MKRLINKFLTLICTCCLITMIFPITANATREAASQTTIHVYILGDSIMAGGGFTDNNIGLAEFLERKSDDLIHYDIIDVSKGGADLCKGIKVQSEVIARQMNPKATNVVLFDGGANDIWHNCTGDHVACATQIYSTLAPKCNGNIFYISPNYLSNTVYNLNDLSTLINLAIPFYTGCKTLYLSEMGLSSADTIDTIHPNEIAYIIMADNIDIAIRNTLRL